MQRVAETNEANGSERDGNQHEDEAEFGLENAIVAAREKCCGSVGQPAGEGRADEAYEEEGDVCETYLSGIEVVGGEGECCHGEDGDGEEEGEVCAVDDCRKENGRVSDERDRFPDTFPEGFCGETAAEEAEAVTIGFLL